MSTGSFKNVIYKICLQIIYPINRYKEDLALNSRQRFICHKTQPNQTKLNLHLTVLDSFNLINTFQIHLIQNYVFKYLKKKINMLPYLLFLSKYAYIESDSEKLI